MTIPADATFRRAEGLHFLIHPCQGLLSATVTARRIEGDTTVEIGLAEVRLLGRLNRWQRADELGVAHAQLVSLVRRNLAFWSPERPQRDLNSEPVAGLDSGTIALRPNVTAVPICWEHTDDGPTVSRLPVMPRRGALEGVVLAGSVFTIYEWDIDVAKVLFNCCARHDALIAQLVVDLDGRKTAEEVAPDGERRALLALLNDLGLLERHTARRWDGSAQVTWMGHAGVIYEAAGTRLAIDPGHFHGSVPSRQPDTPFDLRELGELDAVLITHGDSDHLSPNALYRVARRTPIVIPSTSHPQPYQVDMRGLLTLLGFENVIEVDPWQRLHFGDVVVVATPFRGEDWGLDLACRSYVVHSPDLTIYLNADSTSTPEAYPRIRDEFAIDVAFVGVTGAAETYLMPPGFGYGEYYAHWIPPERRNEWVQLCNGPRESAEVARALGARWAVGYAAGGGSFYYLAYTDRGTHAELAACLSELGGTTRPLALEIGVPTRVPRVPRGDP